MTQQRVLSEIPIRMDRLRVSTDEEDSLMLQNTFNGSPFDNISWNYSPSSQSSPDEMVIRQRGRRSTSILWSPEKIRDSLTPIRSIMTLRSSPRKRLLQSDITRLTPEQHRFSTTKKATPSPSKQTVSGSKRLKFDDKPISQSNTSTPLTTILKGMSQDQLIAIISGIVKENPELEQKVRNELPMPDIRKMEEELSNAKRNIYKSLPTSRLAKKTDSISYSRAATHLITFKKIIIEHTMRLFDSKNWDALLDYTMMAWSYTKSTPIWDSHSHNACRRSCFKTLAHHLLASLKSGNTLLGECRISELSNRIVEMSNEYDDPIIMLSIEVLNDIHSHL